jgi:hypothetical protein
MKSAVFGVVTPCNPTEIHQIFQRNVLCSSAGWKSKPCRKPARNRWQASQKIILFIFTTLRTSNPMMGKCFLGIDVPRTVVKSIVLGVAF